VTSYVPQKSIATGPSSSCSIVNEGSKLEKKKKKKKKKRRRKKPIEFFFILLSLVVCLTAGWRASWSQQAPRGPD
jgi:hypothetical protein